MGMRGVLAGFGRSQGVAGAPDPTTTVGGDACEATLPSSSAVDRLFDGDPWAIPAVIMSTGLRGALIGAGAYVAGVRGSDVLKAAVGGALGIEAFVIAYVGYQKWSEARAAAASAASGSAASG